MSEGEVASYPRGAASAVKTDSLPFSREAMSLYTRDRIKSAAGQELEARGLPSAIIGDAALCRVDEGTLYVASHKDSWASLDLRKSLDFCKEGTLSFQHIPAQYGETESPDRLKMICEGKQGKQEKVIDSHLGPVTANCLPVDVSERRRRFYQFGVPRKNTGPDLSDAQKLANEAIERFLAYYVSRGGAEDDQTCFLDTSVQVLYSVSADEPEGMNQQGLNNARSLTPDVAATLQRQGLVTVPFDYALGFGRTVRTVFGEAFGECARVELSVIKHDGKALKAVCLERTQKEGSLEDDCHQPYSSESMQTCQRTITGKNADTPLVDYCSFRPVLRPYILESETTQTVTQEGGAAKEKSIPVKVGYVGGHATNLWAFHGDAVEAWVGHTIEPAEWVIEDRDFTRWLRDYMSQDELARITLGLKEKLTALENKREELIEKRHRPRFFRAAQNEIWREEARVEGWLVGEVQALLPQKFHGYLEAHFDPRGLEGIKGRQARMVRALVHSIIEYEFTLFRAALKRVHSDGAGIDLAKSDPYIHFDRYFEEREPRDLEKGPKIRGRLPSMPVRVSEQPEKVRSNRKAGGDFHEVTALDGVPAVRVTHVDLQNVRRKIYLQIATAHLDALQSAWTKHKWESRATIGTAVSTGLAGLFQGAVMFFSDQKVGGADVASIVGTGVCFGGALTREYVRDSSLEAGDLDPIYQDPELYGVPVCLAATVFSFILGSRAIAADATDVRQRQRPSGVQDTPGPPDDKEEPPGIELPLTSDEKRGSDGGPAVFRLLSIPW
jgi:hypothetical protein